MSEDKTKYEIKPQDDSTIDGAFRIATAMSKSDMVPKHFQNKPTDCFLALNISKRLNIDPFAVLQNLYVVHGTPAFSSKFLIAMANKSGTFSTPIMFQWTGEGDSLTAKAYAKHAASGEEVSFEFSMADAKAEGYTKNPKYKTMGKLMLAYRAATLFTRLYCPESAMGAVTVEEAEDMKYAKGEASAPRYEVENLLEDEPQSESVEVAEVLPPEKVEEKTCKPEGTLL